MVNKKPEVTREGNIVLINCFEEKAATLCEKEIKKVLTNRVLQMMIMRKIKR